MENENITVGTRVEILDGINKGLSATVLDILTETHSFDYLVNVYGEIAYYYENEIKKIR